MVSNTQKYGYTSLYKIEYVMFLFFFYLNIEPRCRGFSHGDIQLINV